MINLFNYILLIDFNLSNANDNQPLIVHGNAYNRLMACCPGKDLYDFSPADKLIHNITGKEYFVFQDAQDDVYVWDKNIEYYN